MDSLASILAGLAALVLYPRVEVNQVANDFNRCVQTESLCTVEMKQCLADRYNCKIKGFSLLYKKQINDEQGQRSEFREDRERGYPALIKDTLPQGLVGLALVALMGAFMSTVSTHINWGASYITNDFYLRMVNPQANNSQLLLVSRLATISIALAAIVVASFVNSVGAMWELYLGMMAGLGIPHLLRWFWWRANAWTEIAGMLTGFSLALLNYVAGQKGWYPPGQMSIFPEFLASHAIHVICWISLFAAMASIIATLATSPVDPELLREFVRRTRPMGFWGDYTHGDFKPERSFAESLLYFALAGVSIYAGMFGVGYLLRLEMAPGLGLMTLCLVTLVVVVRGMGRIDRAV